MQLTLFGSSFGGRAPNSASNGLQEMGYLQAMSLDSQVKINYSASLDHDGFLFDPWSNSSCRSLFWTSDSSVSCSTPPKLGLKARFGIVVSGQLALLDSTFNYAEWSQLVGIDCNISKHQLS